MNKKQKEAMVWAVIAIAIAITIFTVVMAVIEINTPLY